MKYLSGNPAPSRRLGRFLIFVGACLVLLANANAGERPEATQAGSSIRSAQLFARDGRWESVVPRSAGDERAEIRAHFAAVRRILMQDTPTSLDVAVIRFEQAFDLSLTPARRAVLRDKLAARRTSQLERLADYARAGRFPLNRHYAGEARPIFVDARGTHCAVGHLMALDGWETDVVAIARAKPNVLVREVTGGPLVTWLLTSGLIQEEAALIQPAYYPPPSGATRLSDLVVPGASLDRDGFRYENFGFAASSTGGAATPTVAQFGLFYGWPPVATGPHIFCGTYNTMCVPRQDAFWFGVYYSPTSFGGSLLAAADQSISIVINYDVVALAAGLAVSGANTFEDPLFGGFTYFGSPVSGGQASVATTVDGDTSGLLELLLTGGYDDSESAQFDTPTSRVHIQHSIQIADNAAFTSFDSVTLRPVPLPGSAALLALALGVLGHFRRPETPRIPG